MKRRSLLQSIVALPVATAASVPPETPQQIQFNAETPITPVVAPAETAKSLRRTFTPDQFYALTRIGELIVPPFSGLPGSAEAEAATFLDFFIGASPKASQDLYRNGLDTLNRKSHSEFGQTFANINAQQAATLLAPLQDPNSTNPLAPFLRAAKSDILRATFNSRVYIDAVSQTRRPRNASKYFWYPIT